MIPEALRARITVLFHASLDHKVANHCEKVGCADVIELVLREWRTLAPGFEILCDTSDARKLYFLPVHESGKFTVSG